MTPTSMASLIRVMTRPPHVNEDMCGFEADTEAVEEELQSFWGRRLDFEGSIFYAKFAFCIHFDKWNLTRSPLG